MADRPRSNVDDPIAVKRQRLELYARVLEFQRVFVRDWGREPTVEEVAKAIEGCSG